MSIRITPTLLLVASVSLMTGCHARPDHHGAAAGRTSDHANYLASIDKVYAAFGSGDDSCVDACVAKNFVEHAVPPPGVTSTGMQCLKDSIAWFHTAFPDCKMTVLSSVVAGDTIYVHFNQKGTNRGPMGPGMPATGKTMDVNGVDIVRFENGKAVEHWGYMDETRMNQQLGLAPMPGSSGK